MILAAKTNKPQRGFTLIEIVMVLAISAMLMGGAIGLMIFSSDERVLRNASGEIELLAKNARTISILNQTPYALEFREGTVRLLPFAQAGQDLEKSKKSRGDAEEESVDESRQIQLESGVEVAVRHWNSEEWLKTEKKNVHVWRFDPDGLCEPLSVKLTLGKSWSVDTYHPLTATISESELEAK